MQPSELYPLLGETIQAMTFSFTSYQAAVRDAGLEPGEWGTLAVMHDYAPEPGTAARFALRNPYANPRIFAERLAALAEKGFAESVGEGAYALTSAGNALVARLVDILNETLGALEPAPADDLARGVALVSKLIDAIAAVEEPDNLHFRTNRHSDAGPDMPPLMRLLQFRSDIGAFRDDAHLAAWRPLGVSGPVWEAFTYLWQDTAHTAAELAEQLTNREWDVAAYAAALDELVARDWVAADGDQYTLTEAGRTQRQAVEDLTDRYFYAPWDTFTPAERVELGTLLTQMKDGLHALAPAAEEA